MNAEKRLEQFELQLRLVADVGGEAEASREFSIASDLHKFSREAVRLLRDYEILLHHSRRSEGSPRAEYAMAVGRWRKAVRKFLEGEEQ